MKDWIRKRISNVLNAFAAYGATVVILDYTDTPADLRIGLAIVLIALGIAIILDEVWPEKE
jgi:hypothetical protein